MAKEPQFWGVDKKKVSQAKKVFAKLSFADMVPKLNKIGYFDIYGQDIFSFEIGRADSEIPPHTLSSIKKEFRYNLRQPAIDTGISRTPFTLNEIFPVVYGASSALDTIPKTHKLYRKMALITETLNDMMKPITWVLTPMISRILLSHSSITGIGLLYQKPEDARTLGGEDIRLRFMVHVARPEIRYLEIDGKKRKIYETLFEVNARKDYNKMMVTMDGESLPCFVQAHAIKRIEERYDICLEWVARESVFDSGHEKEVITYKGKSLIPITIKEDRVGYLLCERIDEIVLIKTFLLVTQDGTPEGDRLNRELSIEKYEKSLLNFDRLSSFKPENIERDPLLKEILARTELSYLIEMNIVEPYIPPYLDLTGHYVIDGREVLVLNPPTARQA